MRKTDRQFFCWKHTRVFLLAARMSGYKPHSKTSSNSLTKWEAASFSAEQRRTRINNRKSALLSEILIAKRIFRYFQIEILRNFDFYVCFLAVPPTLCRPLYTATSDRSRPPRLNDSALYIQNVIVCLRSCSGQITAQRQTPAPL